MKQFLDSSGLNLYHHLSKRKVDASINELTIVDENLTNQMEELTNDLQELTDLVSQVKLEVSPTMIYVGDSSTLNFTATCKDSADSIVIKDQNDTTIASGSGTSLVGTTSVTPDSEGILLFTCNALIGGVTYTSTVKVNVVGKIYYGCGQTDSSATSIAPINDKPNGLYTLTVSNKGDYIFFVVPASMRINNISMNGLEVPMSSSSTTKGGIPYTVYKSTNGYNTGTYKIIINNILPAEDSSTSVSDIVYYGNGTVYTDTQYSKVVKDTAMGVYPANIDLSGTYVFFNVPASMSVAWIMLNGSYMPVTETNVTINGKPYVSYKSINTYQAGDYVFYIE